MLKFMVAILWAMTLGAQPGNLAWAQSTIFHAYTNPKLVPDFSLESLQGKSVDVRDFRGQVLLINFWATW